MLDCADPPTSAAEGESHPSCCLCHCADGLPALHVGQQCYAFLAVAPSWSLCQQLHPLSLIEPTGAGIVELLRKERCCLGLICTTQVELTVQLSKQLGCSCRASAGSKGGAAHRGGFAEALRGPAAGDRAARCPAAAPRELLHDHRQQHQHPQHLQHRHRAAPDQPTSHPPTA